MTEQHPFKWRHFQSDIILLCVRWYLRYSLSYRDLEEMMLERGLHMDHTTIYRWVQQYAPELDRRCRPHLKATTDSWRVDETYIKIKKQWMYLYRAVDSHGNTLEFLLSPTRDAEAAKRFFLKTLAASHTGEPRVINVDKNAAYPKAFNELKAAGMLPESCELRQVKYLNNRVEQDHRFMVKCFTCGEALIACEEKNLSHWLLPNLRVHRLQIGLEASHPCQILNRGSAYLTGSYALLLRRMFQPL